MKTVKDLINEKVKEMGDDSYEYECTDSGKTFMASSDAKYSPYTGEKKVKVKVKESGFQKNTPVPSNQKDPMTQKPLKDNPSKDKDPKDWKTNQLKSNPAPDKQGAVGVDTANKKGHVL